MGRTATPCRFSAPMADSATDSPPPDTSPAKRRSLPEAAIAIALLVAAGFAIVGIARRSRETDEPGMASLAAYVLEHGEPAWVPASCLEFFGVPPNEIGFRQLKAVSQSGRTKAVQVRKRPDAAHVDVFFLDLRPNDTRGDFYLTSTHGRLTKAAYFDAKPEPIADADRRFNEQKEFWFLWQREKTKWTAERKQ